MMYNRSEIMKAAWVSAKSPLKQLHMKEWFANKVANEICHNLRTTEIFAVLKETAKALYVMLAIAPNCTRCVWVPKSCTEECTGSNDFHTRFGLSYEEATFEARLFWSAFC